MSDQRPDGPKEGIYLDAALEAVAARVDDRIDGIAARRRLRTRALVGVLSVTTVLGGAAAAAALTVANDSDATAAPQVIREVSCVAGADPTAVAYFAARYRILEAEADRFAPEDLCEVAWSYLVASPELSESSPDRLLATAAELARSTAEPREVDGEPAPAPQVQALSSSFGRLGTETARGVAAASCGPEGDLTVLLTVPGLTPEIPTRCDGTTGEP